MSGFIKLHRGWHDSTQFAADPYCERAAWCWLLTSAAWKDTMQRNHKGEPVAVGRGQFRTSLRTLAAEWKWSVKRVRTFLKVLEKCAAIGTQKAQGGTLITICNYDEYQSTGHTAGTQGGTLGAQSGHTKEEGKEKKERKNTALARPDDVPADLWADFITVRKAHKAPMTENALDGLRREAEKAGWPLKDAIHLCVTNGWRGFQSHYVKGRTPQGAGTDPEYTGP